MASMHWLLDGIIPSMASVHSADAYGSLPSATTQHCCGKYGKDVDVNYSYSCTACETIPATMVDSLSGHMNLNDERLCFYWVIVFVVYTHA